MDELAAAKPPEGVESQRLSGRGFGVPFHRDTNRLQGEFVRRIDRHLAEKGKRMIGWDEVLDSGLDKRSRAAVMAWRNDVAIAGVEARIATSWRRSVRIVIWITTSRSR